MFDGVALAWCGGDDKGRGAYGLGIQDDPDLETTEDGSSASQNELIAIPKTSRSQYKATARNFLVICVPLHPPANGMVAICFIRAVQTRIPA